jgi:uracil-DNA glycosylase family 4
MTLDRIQDQIINCTRCPRLREHCAAIAVQKRRAYSEWVYWGRPVPSFGDPQARLLILGLAPGAHGANRTGRMFTGDSSGDLLYRVLHRTGFASQPTSRSDGDGLVLRDAYITASAHCAPPGNKPLPAELRNCRPFVEAELDAMRQIRVVVALGKIAFDTYLSILAGRRVIAARTAYPFGHAARYNIDGRCLIASYHPSQQNTSTGKLTESMLLEVFNTAKEILRQPATVSLTAAG